MSLEEEAAEEKGMGIRAALSFGLLMVVGMGSGKALVWKMSESAV